MLFFFVLALYLSGCNDMGKSSKEEHSKELDLIIESDLGKIAINAMGNRDLIIKNPSSSLNKIEIKDLKDLGDHFSIVGKSFPGSGGNCNRALAPGKNCSIPIEVKAGSNIETLSQKVLLIVESQGKIQNKHLTLSANVVQQLNIAELISEPTALDFGSISLANVDFLGNPKLKAKIVKIENPNEIPAKEVQIFPTKHFAILETTNPETSQCLLGGALLGKKSCEIEVKLGNISEVGSINEVLIITYTIDNNKYEIKIPAQVNVNK
jgi:hypothetical protein